MTEQPFGAVAAVYAPDRPDCVVLEHGHEIGGAVFVWVGKIPILSRACLPIIGSYPGLRAAVTHSSICVRGIPRTSQSSPIRKPGDWAIGLVNSISAGFLPTSGNKIASPNRDVVIYRT